MSKPDARMRVRVDHVNIPAYSTLGYAEGVDEETGERVRFAGDHRPMRDIGEDLERGGSPVAEVEDWQVFA